MKIFNMLKFIKYNKIRLKNGEKLKLVQLFGKNILRIKKTLDKKYEISFLGKHDNCVKKNNVFYLKINGVKEKSLECFQKWIDIANLLYAKVYIVVDDKKTEYSIYDKIKFHNCDFELIGSKIKKLKSYAKSISCDFWYNAVSAELAIFYHARKNGYKHFWKIDADDTMFCINDDKIAELLRNAENKAKEQDIRAFSLDMHASQLGGKYWSFGICYVDNSIDWFSVFKKYMGDDWWKKYEEEYKESINIDWFFTYLKDKNILNIKSFYIDEAYFYHYGDRISEYMTLSHWHNGLLEYPNLKIFNSKFSSKPIFRDNICIGSVCKTETDACIKKDILNEAELYSIFSIYDKSVWVLYPPQGLGDILFVCSLIREYRKVKKEKKIVVWITKKHFYDLVKLYADDVNDIVFSNEAPGTYCNVLNICDNIYKNKTFFDRYQKNQSFKKEFTVAMGLDEKAQLYFPDVEIAEDKSLSNTIMIAPDAVSCTKIIGDEAWLKLSDELLNKGYDVVFNCGNAKRFGSCSKVFWDIKTTIQKVNNMKAFISYRSGLADVVGAFCRNTPQYIIYPSEKLHNIGNFKTEQEAVKAYFDFCSIRKNFDNGKVNEYIYGNSTMSEILATL